MNTTKLFTALTATAFALAIGFGIAFARVPPAEELPSPCVGVVSIDFGADGSIDAVDEIAVPDCGTAAR